MKPTLAFSLVLALAGCSGISTSVDYDSTANFQNLKSWAWYEGDRNGGTAARPMNELVANRVRSAVESDLKTRGYVHATNDTPDFWVLPSISLGQRIDAS